MNLWRERLTRRQRQVLHLMAAGYTNREIAGCLGVVYDTNRRHRKGIYTKLGVQNRTEAVVMALRFEIVDRAAVYAEIDRRQNNAG